MRFAVGLLGAFLMIGMPAMIWSKGNRGVALGMFNVGVAMMVWSNWQWLLIWTIFVALSTLQRGRRLRTRPGKKL
ncbi:hypothetical protein [Alicyclobacillus sp. ALC3]|uniref:hypothetical protein n=1 Tax=Alicyclobacillus sp. ALC3 TaxID=2796143 RepID=UPI002377FD65|nr:hypothetical protein [Alicyclobacillus sp. ALC3]WDL98110.1 hypothetical protein JC200_05260 [Alicyclobacillus sp. ALC3]